MIVCLWIALLWQTAIVWMGVSEDTPTKEWMRDVGFYLVILAILLKEIGG